jgi:hypothetical protein
MELVSESGIGLLGIRWGVLLEIVGIDLVENGIAILWNSHSFGETRWQMQ